MRYTRPGKLTYRFIATLCFSLTVALFFAGTPMTSHADPGDLDPTFGNGGRIPPPSGPPTVSAAFGVAVQPDRKILVAGVERDFPGQTPSGPQRLVLTRYMPNGSLDLTFGTGGSVFIALSEQCLSWGDDLTLQDDGKIVVTGNLDGCGQETGAYVLRFLPDGSLDPTFDGDGKLRILGLPGFYTTTCKVAAQSDGKLVLSCGEWRWEEDYWQVILRLDPDGSFDKTFGGGFGQPGRVYLGSSSFFPFDIAIQSDGKIVAATEIDLTIGRSIVLTRLSTDGSVDSTFGNSGWVVTSGGEFALDTRAISIQPDNKIVVVGSYQSLTALGGHVTRYLPNGSLDTSFGGSGMILNSAGSPYYSSLAIQSNGKIVAASDWGYRVTRFLRSGALDKTFGVNGQVLTDFPNPVKAAYPSGGISDLAIQRDGKIITSGYWQGYEAWPDVNLAFRYPAIARYAGDSKAAYDFNGDGRSDIAVFRPVNSVWYLNLSGQGFAATQFGLPTDKIAPADYDGDGKADIAVFRDGVWWRINSSNSTVIAHSFGIAGDLPVPADYTGDGRDELAVYRNGQWWALDLSNSHSSLINFGLATDKPVVGDYDGDGRVDQAVYRNGEWHINRSTLGYTVAQFGLSSDRPVVGDYDGDGKSDPAVYRDGTWYLQRSQAGFTAFQFGLASDIPAPTDYDGDGKADAAVYRDGIWYLLQSTTGISIQGFGLAGDKPVPAAFVP